MKKIALAAGSVIAASAFTASMASAQIAPGTYTLQTNPAIGQTLAVQQSLSLNCQATLSLTVHAGGTTGSVSSGTLSPGDGLCSSVNLGGFSWPVTIGPVSGGTQAITISGVAATTILGSCTNGTLRGTAGGGVVNITSSSGWTSTPSFFSCSVTGQLSY